MTRIRSLVLSLAAAAVLGACSAETATTTPTGGESGGGDAPASSATLKFSAIPDADFTAAKETWSPVAKYLSDKLGVPVEYVPAKDYKASVEMFKNGQIHLAWFGGLTGVQARAAVEGAHAIAQGKADPEYYSYFIAHASTGLEKSDDFPADIARFPFTFGSESSTSGRLMPEYFIRKFGKKAPREFFQQGFGFSGAHDKTATQVQEGTTAKVGALSYKAYDKLVQAGKIDPDVCKVIWKTPFYADYNLTAHPELDRTYGEGFTKKLQSALLAMDDTALLRAYTRDQLIPAKDEEFQGIADTAKELGLLR